jgi:hypothetical protein
MDLISNEYKYQSNIFTIDKTAPEISVNYYTGETETLLPLIVFIILLSKQ